MSGLRAEDVKEAILHTSLRTYTGDHKAMLVLAAARAWLTPNYEAAGRRANELVSELRHKWRPLYGSDVKAIVDAALGIHPGDEGDER